MQDCRKAADAAHAALMKTTKTRSGFARGLRRLPSLLSARLCADPLYFYPSVAGTYAPLPIDWPVVIEAVTQAADRE